MKSVSIIVPCFNERETIGFLLTAIYHQSFGVENLEVVISDGMSTDGTRDEIRRFLVEHPEMDVKIVDNKDRNIPSGLNRAIEASQGEYIIRLDAHSIPSENYVCASIETLELGQGDNVGGVWEIKPSGDGCVQRSISVAASHPLGVGDALYRVGSTPRPVDTVPFGAFQRKLIDKIGNYDETLLSNEDYEFNARIRQSGGVVWLNPEIHSVYFARSSYSQLARQYWRYGYWKTRMLIRYPNTLRWRQLAGLFVLSWLVLGISSFWLPVAGYLLILEAVVYGTALLISGIQTASEKNDLCMLIGVPIAIGIMHFSWGSGFLWSAAAYIISRLFHRSKVS